MRKLFAAILLGGLLLLLCSCVDREEKPVEDQLINSINHFSYRSAQVLLQNRTDNFNYSPLSLYYALALAGTGAEGQTKHQILDLLGVSSEKELSVQCGELYQLLYTDNDITKLKIANSIWLDDDVIMKKRFASDAAKYFHASAASIDFSDEASAEIMAKWISDNTNGTITPKLDVDPSQVLSIINTVYFYDQWINQFDEKMTHTGTFHAARNDVAADFMNRDEISSEFFTGDHFTRSSLGLKGSGQMIFVLPDQGTDISDLMTTEESLKSLFEDGERHMGEVVWKIPKFSFDSKCELKDTLMELGMKKAFEDDADFSGITDDAAAISDVLQQTHIAINEDGVEASAFTQIDYCGMALPDGKAEMILDRPFLYGITAPNGALLFVGICNDPSRQDIAQTNSFASNAKEAANVQYTEDQIMQYFDNFSDSQGCTATDCVLVPDHAYGLIGIVQYTDETGNPCNLSFVNDPSFGHPVGLDSDGRMIITDNTLEYKGNGAVTLTLYDMETNESYDYTVEYAYADKTRETHFNVSSKKTN